MSKKTKKSRKNKHNHDPGKLHPDTRAGQRLARLAKAALKNPIEDNEFKLFSKIENHLESGHDRVFEEAFNLLYAESEENDAVVAYLEDSVEYASQNLVLTKDDLLPVIETLVPVSGGIDLSTTLFACPIIMLAPEANIPKRLKCIDTLAKSFRKQGLIGPEPDLVLSPFFYRLTDLSKMTHSQRYRFLKQLALSLYIPATDLSKFIPQSAFDKPAESESRQYTLAMGFLVGATMIGELCDEDPFFPVESDREVYDRKVETWSQEVEKLLTEETGMDMITVCAPEMALDAIKTGIDLYRAMSLKFAITAAIQETARHQETCRAVIGNRVQDGVFHSVAIGLHGGTGRFINGYAWPIMPFDDLESMFDSLTDIVTENGVDEIALVKEEIEFDGCPCCGEPLELKFPDTSKETGNAGSRRSLLIARWFSRGWR